MRSNSGDLSDFTQVDNGEQIVLVYERANPCGIESFSEPEDRHGFRPAKPRRSKLKRWGKKK